jgi:IS30 family transposase
MSQYAHLTLSRRQVIENMNDADHTQSEIALAIGADQSTVSRELRRLPVDYCASNAQAHASALAAVPTIVPLLDRRADIVGHLAGFLHQKYSIAQGLALIARKYPDLPTITAQAVYDWLYSCDAPIKKALRKLMVRPRSRRRSRTKTATNKGKIVDMTPISQRPDVANDRSEFGHWEGDLIIGKGGLTAAITMVERVSRFTVTIKVSCRKSQTVVGALARRMRKYEVKSITWDQGKELALHKRLTRLLGVPVFFAEPHSPWQRGTNENTNGVLRRHLPKGTSLDIQPAKLRSIQNLVNNRPMPVLLGATPKEAYAAQVAIMHLGL